MPPGMILHIQSVYGIVQLGMRCYNNDDWRWNIYKNMINKEDDENMRRSDWRWRWWKDDVKKNKQNWEKFVCRLGPDSVKYSALGDYNRSKDPGL